MKRNRKFKRGDMVFTVPKSPNMGYSGFVMQAVVLGYDNNKIMLGVSTSENECFATMAEAADFAREQYCKRTGLSKEAAEVFNHFFTGRQPKC